MTEIETIIELRKKYAYKLYEFYNFLESKPFSNDSNLSHLLQTAMIEEANYWNKWQNRIEKLQRFNREIQNFNQKDNALQLTQNKLLEIAYLRSSFEKQTEDCKKHYFIILSKLRNVRQECMNDIIYSLLSLAVKDNELYNLQQDVNKHYPFLKNHCENWKNKQIEILQNITYSIYEIEMLCQIISQELETFESQGSNDENLAYFDKLKSMFFADQCAKLSESMEKFLTTFNITELLEKLKSEDSFLFKEEFSGILGSKGLGTIRNNIKIINNISSTQKKIHIIYQTFKKLQLILQPELNKILQKKNKLTLLCTDASELSRMTTEKWITSHYQTIFEDIDKIILTRSAFLENHK
jgi:hypothetical protein